jgi:hypothetical protein
MSNDAVDLIHASKLDEAEQLCNSLLEDFPNLPDGHMRLGQLSVCAVSRRRLPNTCAWPLPLLDPRTTPPALSAQPRNRS